MSCSLRSNLQVYLVFISACLNAILGIFLRELDLQDDTKALLAFPGELYFRFMKLMVMPLTVTSIIASAGKVNVKTNSAIVIRTFAYFLGTQALSGALGILIGSRINFKQSENEFNSTTIANSSQSQLMDHILDIGRGLIPDNLISAGFEMTFTKQLGDGTTSLETKRGVNMMGLVFFSFLFGSVIGVKKQHNVILFFQFCFESLISVLSGFMWTAPIGVGSIVLNILLNAPNLKETIQQLALFIAVIIITQLFYQAVILQLIYFLLTRKNPYRLYYNSIQPIITAFTTASSLATMPITFRAVDRKVMMNKTVSRLVIPLGITLNTDGSVMFICIAANFICQIQSTNLMGSQFIVVWLLATVLSMTMASPSVIILMTILSSIGLPSDRVMQLFAVDFLADRFRTCNNMLGDIYAASVVEFYSSKQLRKITEERSLRNSSN